MKTFSINIVLWFTIYFAPVIEKRLHMQTLKQAKYQIKNKSSQNALYIHIYRVRQHLYSCQTLRNNTQVKEQHKMNILGTHKYSPSNLTEEQ